MICGAADLPRQYDMTNVTDLHNLNSIIPGHKVADTLLTVIRTCLDALGLEHEKSLEEVLYVAAVVIFAVVLGWIVRRAVLWSAQRIVAARNSNLTRDLLHQKVLTKCSHIITPLVILALLPFAINSTSMALTVAERILVVYTLVVGGVAIQSVMTFIWTRFDLRNNTKNLPLKGILNVGVGIMWIILVIISVSVLVHRSPAMLLTGLGAFAAALMLIFKDSILGFVAGLQLSNNDMLRIGDWIVVPSTIANGIVTDVSLTAVKVQNWDNTIVTLPPYTLVSTSFQNWRGMSESGWRLVNRNILFDTDSVRPADAELLQAVGQLDGVKEFLAYAKDHGQPFNKGLAVVNGSADTNLGLFRAYACNYLLHHSLVGTDQQILVRLQTPTAEGIPVNIYFYTSTDWTQYEAVQSEVFEHLTVMSWRFGLRPVSGDYRHVYIPDATKPEPAPKAVEPAATDDKK